MSKYLRQSQAMLLVLLCAFCICLPLYGASAGEAPSAGVFYTSPVGAPPVIERGFEKPPKKWLAGHRGVDMQAEPGSEVLAPAEGVVSFSGKVVDRTVITIRHPDGRLSSFEPVAEPLPAGKQVSAGDVIATVDPGVKHCPPTHCLHWGVRTGKDNYINPLLLLDLEKPSILLPIGEDFSA